MEHILVREKGELDLKQMLSIPYLLSPRLNPAKTELAYVTNMEGKFDLYIMDLASGESKQITTGDFSQNALTNYSWLDNANIIFSKDIGGSEQNNLFLLDVKSKIIDQLTNTPNSPEYVVDTKKDGKSALFISTRHGQMNIYQLNVKTKEITQLTIHERPIGYSLISYSPDGNIIAYCANEEDDRNNQDIYTYDLNTREVNRILQISSKSRETFALWNDNSSKFAFITDVNGSNQCGIYNIATGKYDLYGNADLEEVPKAFVEGGRKLLCLRNENGTTKPIYYDITTKECGIYDFPEGYTILIYPGSPAFEKLSDNEVIFEYLTTSKNQFFCKLNTETGKNTILLELNIPGIDSSLFSSAQHVWYDSSDGIKVPAILYKPRDFDPSKSYPGMIIPHGGPTAQTSMGFVAIRQIWTDRNYVVLYPNFRGSTGYGRKWLDGNIKDIGGMDFEDWSAGVNYLVENCSVDPRRIGIYGISYGGYATMLSVTKKPNLWKAACAWVGISHWMNLYDKSMPHFKEYIIQLFGDPTKEETQKLIEDRSPLNYISKDTSPILILHGINDPRCPI
ncbi:MAG: prolyl oligopeptidase family serine peptidase, partial [Candidatus Heimdallarchaeota archaeon]|nr:prolyl oligopeptidase family serine peptidase [Candidatus Heimdallarchaeota archaeon]